MIKKVNFANRIFSFVLAVALLVTPSAMVSASEKADSNGAAYVVFGKTMINNKAQAFISSTPTDVNYNLIEEREGRECVVTQLKRTTANRNNGVSSIPIKVDDDYIGEKDRNVAVKVTYFDRGWDTLHVQYHSNDRAGALLSHDIVKYGSNTWRTATIILREPVLANQASLESDIVINAAEAQLLWEEEFISKVEIINLDKTYADPKALKKSDILHTEEARAFSELGLFGAYNSSEAKLGLDKAVTFEEAIKSAIGLSYGGTNELKSATCSAKDVSDDYKSYVGLALSKGIIKLRSDGTIGAKDIVTMKQLLDLYILVLENNGYRDIGDNTLKVAQELGLAKHISGRDEHSITGFPIYNVVPGLWTQELANLDRYAYMDDLAGLTFAMSKCTVKGKTSPVLANLFNNGVFKRETMIATHSGELIYQFYRQTGFKLEEHSYVDPDTGVTINYLLLPGLPSSGGYVHSMVVSADGRYLVVGTAIDTSSNYGVIVAYDRQTKETITLHPDMKESYYYAYMIAEDTNEIYYTCAEEFYCYDLKTGKNRFICKQDLENGPDDVWCQVPSVTANGDWAVLTGYDKISRKNYTFDVINTRTGEMKKPFDRDVIKTLRSPIGDYTPTYYGHVNINPVYENLFFYILHYEETTAPYELWVYDANTNTHKCVYADHMKDDMSKKDMSSSHWIWSADGEKIYYIHYTSSDYAAGVDQAGIGWLYKDGRSDYLAEGYISADYSYNHVGVSSSDRYFIGDHTSKWSTPNNRFEGKISVFDKETGKSRLLANKAGIWVSHPGHGHALISKDESTVVFTLAVDNYQLASAFVDMTTLPEIDYDSFKTAYAVYGEKNIEKGVELFYEYPDRAYYSNTDVTFENIGGKTALKIDTKHKAAFEVLSHYANAYDSTITFRVEFFDNGSEPIEILYNSTHFEANPGNRKNWVAAIKRTNTNQWVTREVTVKDAAFMNAGAGCGDFAISAINSKTPVYVKSVYVSADDKITEVNVDTSGVEGQNTVKAFTEDTNSPIAVKGNYKMETREDGTQYAKITGDGYVSFAIDDSVKAENGGKVKLAVSYYDMGLGYITLQYNSKNMVTGVPSSKDYMPYKISRSGKNVWKTEIIELADAKFEGRQSDGADFRIIASNSNVPVYIKQVELITE